MQVFMVKEGRLGGENTSKLEFCLHSPEKTPYLPDSVLPFCGLERFSSQQRKWPFGDICSPIRGRWEQLPSSPLAPGWLSGQEKADSLQSILLQRVGITLYGHGHRPVAEVGMGWGWGWDGTPDTLTQQLVKRLFFNTLVQFLMAQVCPP